MTNPTLPVQGKVYCLDTATLSTSTGPHIVFLAVHADTLKIAHIEMHTQQEMGSYKQFILNLASKENLALQPEPVHFIMGIEKEQSSLVVSAFPFLESVVADAALCKEICQPAWAFLATALDKG
jgi:hypothetical protein